MPGTIQVSVLDFMGLQSSTPPLLLCLKVSMGKREYQTWDKGDFSFPLTTLRDNLIVTLQDAEGNTISHTGVETRLVVEKGIWHDSFPLEGGGYVHMKLQFVLSEDERQRIRIMRESAFKKRHGEILNSSLRSQGSATTVSSEVSSSLSLDHQVPAVSSKEVASHAGLEEVATGLVSVPFSQDPKSGAENIKGFYPDQKQINPNDTDRNEETSSTNPVSRGTEVHLTEFSPKKVKAQTLADAPVRTTCAEETSSLLGSSDSVIAAKGNSLPMKLEGDGAHNPGKQGPLEKTPSNVRKMISAFESGLAQDTRPRIKPPLTKSQSRKIAMESHLEDPSLKEDNMEKDKPERPISETVKECFLTGELQQTSTNKASSWVESSHDTGLLELRAENFQTKGRNSNSKNKSKVVHSEVDAKEDNKFPEDLFRTSAAETAIVLGRLFDEHSGRPCTYIIDGQDSGGKLEGSRSRISPEASQEVNIGGASNNRLKSETCWEDTNYSFQGSAPWIFPDEARRLCVTTGSKLLMFLMGDCRNEEKNYQGQTSLLPTEDTEEHRVHRGTVNEANKVPESSHKLRRSKLENSADDETSTGLVGQAIKVAIMVGFGTLVLFTRQRKSRSN